MFKNPCEYYKELFEKLLKYFVLLNQYHINFNN